MSETRKIGNVSFKISDDWSLNTPKSNQRLEPLISVPKTAVNSKSRIDNI